MRVLSFSIANWKRENRMLLKSYDTDFDYLKHVQLVMIWFFLTDKCLCCSAAEWKLDEPDWTGRLKVVSKGPNLTVRLEDKNSGVLILIKWTLSVLSTKICNKVWIKCVCGEVAIGKMCCNLQGSIQQFIHHVLAPQKSPQAQIDDL